MATILPQSLQILDRRSEPEPLRYWWVNHGQTFRQEFDGGYLWAPKRSKDGAFNASYDFMRSIRPGDAVISYARGAIRGVGIAQSYCYDCIRPEDFGNLGRKLWAPSGWKVNVSFQAAEQPVRPKEHWDKLKPLCAYTYSPLDANGNGKQRLYLCFVTDELATALRILLERRLQQLMEMNQVALNLELHAAAANPDQDEWERQIEDAVDKAQDIDETQKDAIIQARRGQGQFRRAVLERERRCRITGVENPAHLIASHCKPWRDCENVEQRLSGDNGLMLTPSIDHLFDKGHISFDDDGRLLIAPVSERESLSRMGVPTDHDLFTGHFTRDQARFLEYHRDEIFLRSKAPLPDPRYR